MFYTAIAQELWLLWQLKVAIDLPWENRKMAFMKSHCRYLTKLLNKCSLNGPLSGRWFFSAKCFVLYVFLLSFSPSRPVFIFLSKISQEQCEVEALNCKQHTKMSSCILWEKKVLSGLFVPNILSFYPSIEAHVK